MKAVARPAVQNHGGRIRFTGLRRTIGLGGLVFALAFSFLLCFSGVSAHAAPEKWQGVDETVVEKYAVEHGRPPKTHLIEPTGDMLLFAFLIAGTVGGFILGYYYRDFTKKDSGGKTDEG